jgi:hypothetical protein
MWCGEEFKNVIPSEVAAATESRNLAVVVAS